MKGSGEESGVVGEEAGRGGERDGEGGGKKSNITDVMETGGGQTQMSEKRGRGWGDSRRDNSKYNSQQTT